MPENYKKAMELLHNAKFQQFISTFQKTLQEAKTSSKAKNFYSNYIHLAVANLELTKFQICKDICKKIIEKAPQIEDAHVILAISQAYLNQYQKALTLCNLRQEENNKRWKNYFAKGYVLAKMEKYEQAIQSYGIAIIKNKLNNPKIYILQAGCLASANENQKAVKNISYAKMAIQQDCNKNCQNLYKYEVNNIKMSLKIFQKYIKKLKKAEELKEITESQRINFQNTLIKIISKSVEYCNGNLNKCMEDSVLKQNKNNEKQNESEEVDNFQVKSDHFIKNLNEQMKDFQRSFKLKSMKALSSQQTQRNQKNTKVICQWMRQKCSIF